MILSGTRSFTYWGSQDPADWSSSSPNLMAANDYITNRWPGVKFLGCYGVRPMRGATVLSWHSYGAAIDWSFRGLLAWRTVKDQVIRFLIEHSAELHIQAVHDYSGPGLSENTDAGYIWRAYRADPTDPTVGWRKQRESATTGMGQPWADWIHVETNLAGWHDGSPVETRIEGLTDPAGEPADAWPIFDPDRQLWSLWPINPAKPTLSRSRNTDQREAIRYLQGVLAKAGTDPGRIDGLYGPRTERAVILFQRLYNLTPDGWVGRNTWQAIDRHALL